ncbi:MAG: Hpt domain-containing protein [Alkalispirochaetaceae bacterium]
MIDRKSLLERCGEDRALLVELLLEFERRCASQLAELTTDNEDLYRISHRLKGLALNLSMPDLQERAASVERLARSGSVQAEDVRDLRKSLQAACESARAVLREEENA